MAQRSYDFLFKILLIGDSGVGKTELLFKMCHEEISEFISTIGIDFKIRHVELDGKKIRLHIWDTAGQERFRTITTSYYRGAMGIMLVYDITDEKTFENMENWMRNIEKHANEDVVKILVGNKCHLEDRRLVSTKEGEELAASFGANFMEVSVSEGINVQEAIITLTREIKQKMKLKMEKLKLEDPQPTEAATSSCTII